MIFASPQMRWLDAVLKQINRPLDRRNMVTLIESFRSFAGIARDFEELEMRSEIEQVPLMTVWVDFARQALPPTPIMKAVESLIRPASGPGGLADSIRTAIDCFKCEDVDGDFRDDLSAWNRIERDTSGPWCCVA